MARQIDWYIAVFLGENLDAVHTERETGRMWDMMRYDRCYPASNVERFENMGFAVLKQPYQKDIKGGFTVGRWDSFGFKTVFVEMGSPISGSVPFKLEEVCRAYAYRLAERRKQLAVKPK